MSTNRQGSIQSNNPSPRCPVCHGKGTLAHYVCRAPGCHHWYTRDIYEYHAAFHTPLPDCGHPAPKLAEGAKSDCPNCQGKGRVAVAVDAGVADSRGTDHLLR